MQLLLFQTATPADRSRSVRAARIATVSDPHSTENPGRDVVGRIELVKRDNGPCLGKRPASGPVARGGYEPA